MIDVFLQFVAHTTGRLDTIRAFEHTRTVRLALPTRITGSVLKRLNEIDITEEITQFGSHIHQTVLTDGDIHRLVECDTILRM